MEKEAKRRGRGGRKRVREKESKYLLQSIDTMGNWEGIAGARGRKRRGRGKKLFYSQMMSLRSSLDALMMRIMAKDDTDGRIATVSSIHPCLGKVVPVATYTDKHTYSHTHSHSQYPLPLQLSWLPLPSLFACTVNTGAEKEKGKRENTAHCTLVTALSPLIIITVLQFSLSTMWFYVHLL